MGLAGETVRTIRFSAEMISRWESCNVVCVDRHLRLAPEALEGCCQSDVLEVGEFQRCFISWNSITQEGVSIEIRVKVVSPEGESPFFSYGLWSSALSSRRSNKNVDNSVAILDVDEITCFHPAEKIQYQIFLRRDSSDLPSPLVRQITVALAAEAPCWRSTNIHCALLDLPRFRQMDIAEIGKRTCSPTSLAMVLAYYGKASNPAQTAAAVFDPQRNIYGNWAFNIAAAGELQLEAHGQYLDLETVSDLLQRGVPVVASMRASKEPIIDNLPPGGYSSGHLLVVCGFSERNGERFVVVNDPWGESVEAVRRFYKLEQFDRRWRHFGYVLQPISTQKEIR